MTPQQQAPSSPSAVGRVRPSPADAACRRAWWSLALYPVSFVAAFLIGEGMYTQLSGGGGTGWDVLLAFVPALLVFMLPGLGAVVLGRRAMALGRSDGRLPAVLGAAIGVGFLAVNLAGYLVARFVG